MRLTCERISEGDLAHLAELVADMRKAADQGDIERLLALDLRIHNSIWQISGHKRLLELLTNMIGPIRLFQVMHIRLYENLVDNVLEHEQLVRALSLGNRAEAESLMIQHIQEAAATTLEYLGQRRIAEP